MEEELVVISEEQAQKAQTATGLGFAVDMQLAIEKLRVATQVRSSHLAKADKADPFCQDAHRRLLKLEQWIDGSVAQQVSSHPAYPWFSHVRGVGKENIGKVVGQIDFTRAAYVSSLWKFAGYHVVDGKSPRPVKGQKLEYNKNLRVMVWRLASSLMRAKGKYYAYYQEAKDQEVKKLVVQGIKVLPEEQLKPLKKIILSTMKEKRKKELGVKKLPEGEIERIEREVKKIGIPGYMSEGQVHNRALRKMAKLFLSHLWTVSRGAMNLPVSKPYAQEVLEHQHYYDPWEFTDK